MQVKDVMVVDMEIMSPKDTLLKAAKKLAEVDVDSILVCEGKELQGIVTPRDLIKVVAKESTLDQPLENIMTKDIVFVEPESTLENVADLMVEHKIKTIPVQVNGQLRGVVDAGDLIGYEEILIEKLSQIFMLSKKGHAVAG